MAFHKRLNEADSPLTQGFPARSFIKAAEKIKESPVPRGIPASIHKRQKPLLRWEGPALPDGKVHSSATTALVVSTALLWLTKDKVDFPWLIAGEVSGWLLSPDLDVDNGNISMNYVGRVPIIGPALSFLWKVYWYPYAKIMPHRSFLSHFPVISTSIRLLWLFLPIYSLLGVFGINPPLSWGPSLMFFMGLALSDYFHWSMDNAHGEEHT